MTSSCSGERKNILAKTVMGGGLVVFYTELYMLEVIGDRFMGEHLSIMNK